MAEFDHGIAGMASAIGDSAPAGPQPRSDETKAKAAELQKVGWAAQVEYDYAAYNAPIPRGGADDITDWGHKAGRYEWNEEYGDVAPRIPELEKQLFNAEFQNRAGAKLEKQVAQGTVFVHADLSTALLPSRSLPSLRIVQSPSPT